MDLRSPCLLIAVFLLVCFHSVGPGVGAQERAADTEDVATLDGIIRAYYEVVSRPAGVPADRARDATLHHPSALVGMTGVDEEGEPWIRTMTLEEYHESSGGPGEEGFWEWEIHRVTHRLGNMALVWSTYASSTRPGGPVQDRGINSIQLYHDGTRWWILSWIYDRERPGNPIPEEYLPG
jgi:hypothetical protein